MNDFDKRMADLAAARRRNFWVDVRFWVIEITAWFLVGITIGTIIWIA